MFDEPLDIRQRLLQTGTLTFTLRIRPNAQETKFKNILEDGSVKMDVAAPPEDNRANIELIRFLSKTFEVPREAVEIVSGDTSRMKIVRIRRTAQIPGIFDDLVDLL